jgi:hypothetical protein
MRRIAIPILAIVAIAALAAGASGDLTQQGNLRLSFNGKLTPKKLPRKVSAPVQMEVSGAIDTANGERPPELNKISIAFNRYGTVSTKGLPTCDFEQLEQTTSDGALRVCHRALVGHGSFRAYVNFSGTKPVAVVGKALAFNAEVQGKPTVLLQIYGSQPAQVTFVVPFTIHHIPGNGTFGTVFSATIPKIAAHSGYVTNLSLTFDRRYSYKGRRMSFLSARCAVPAGIPGTPFTLARGTFVFANGQRVNSALPNSCWVRH